MKSIVVAYKAQKGRPWVFEFVIEGKSAFAMEKDFYKKNKLKNPVNKNIIDNLGIGFRADIDFVEIDGFLVVTRIKGYRPS